MATESRLELLLEELLVELREIRQTRRLPAVLSKKRAAQELSISLSKLKGLIRSGDIMVCEVGDTTMVPSSEIRRITEAAQAPASPSRSPRPSRTARKVTKPASPAEEARKVRVALKRQR
jgi:hypothetical protein